MSEPSPLQRAQGFNWGLLLTTFAVAGLGILNLSSAARTAESNLALIQGIWCGAGLVLIVVLTVLDYRIFERLAYPLLVLSLLSLLAVFFAGHVAKGGQRWLHFGGVNFQPSELAKIALVVALAKYFSDEPQIPVEGYTIRALIKPGSVLYPVGAAGALLLYWEKTEAFGSWRFLALGVCLLWAAGCALVAIRGGRTTLHDFMNPFILLLLPVILVMRQPDLGTALILFAIAGTMILFAKIKPLSLIILAVVFAGVAVMAWNVALKPYQKERILSFVKPEADVKDTGYHARQSIIGVGSGGISGKGYGESTQTQFKFLPEQQTDFVFSVWAEEWGFTGCLTAIALLCFWILQIVNVVSSAREKFGLFLAVGLLAMVFWQVTINIGMVIGVLPVVGITLPLWSYGGSSVLAVLTGVGLLMSISLRRHSL
jgi:rod shape determining protein RodA